MWKRAKMRILKLYQKLINLVIKVQWVCNKWVFCRLVLQIFHCKPRTARGVKNKNIREFMWTKINTNINILKDCFRKSPTYRWLILSMYHLSNTTCYRIRTNNPSYSKYKERINKLKKKSGISSEAKEFIRIALVYSQRPT